MNFISICQPFLHVIRDFVLFFIVLAWLGYVNNVQCGPQHLD